MKVIILPVLCFCLALIANTIMGSAKAQKAEEFNWKELRDGLLRYGLILGSMSAVYGIGLLQPEFTVVINGTPIVLSNAVIILINGVTIIYVVKTLKNFSEIFEMKKDIKEVESPIELPFAEDEGKG